MSKIKSARTLREPAQLVTRGFVPAVDLPDLEKVAARYAVAVTADLAALIDPRDPDDPIARQFIPSAEELVTQRNEDGDPIGDHTHSPVAGIVHRYPDRVLLKPVQVCAAYCRFCYRREKVGRARGLARAQLEDALDYIRMHPEIWEVILSGGDPLVLSPRRLAAIMRALDAIGHVRVVRVHTRLPVLAPGRITSALVRALKTSGKATYVALHANHARELSAKARAACARLIDAGIPMLSQTVLLRGLNDDADTLGELMRALVECRIKPYYLHHADFAPGTGHWRTGIAEGQALMRSLRGRLSGLCQPTYVLDIPGGAGKSPIGPNYLVSIGDANGAPQYEVEDFNGRRHAYPPATSAHRKKDALTVAKSSRC